MIDEDKTPIGAFATDADGIGGVETWGRYAFDVEDETVHIDGRPIPLTAREFCLALLLFRNLSRPLSRRALLAKVWGGEVSENSRTLDAHISQVRNRLGLRPENGFLLSAVYRFGYRLEDRSVWERTALRGVSRSD